MQPLDPRPGWIAFVEGECADDEYTRQEYDWLKQIMREIMYPFHYTGLDYYSHFGYQRFEFEVIRQVQSTHALHPEYDRPANLRPVLIYFYNRQLMIQMTYLPQKYPGQNIAIPLHKSNDGLEIQADVMFLLPQQQLRAGNQKVLGLMVAIEPFSRFCWIYPFGKIESTSNEEGTAVRRKRFQTDAVSAAKAFENAFTENGWEGNHFYQYLKPKVKRIVTDNGAEFGGQFAQTYRKVFPNAQLYNATPKSNTFGRPTNTGAVEAAIAGIRKALRDQELAIPDGSKFFSSQKSFVKVVKAYNHTRQLSTLRGAVNTFPQGRKRRDVFYPALVARTMMQEKEGGEEDTQTIQEISNRLDEIRTHKIQKFNDVQANYGISVSLKQGSYRLYSPPPLLAKLVRFRLSLELYHITRVYAANNTTVVDIQDENGGVKKGVSLKQLVLVKTPVENGPPIIRQQLQQLLHEQNQQNQTNLQYQAAPQAVQINAPADVNQAVFGPHPPPQALPIPPQRPPAPPIPPRVLPVRPNRGKNRHRSPGE